MNRVFKNDPISQVPEEHLIDAVARQSQLYGLESRVHFRKSVTPGAIVCNSGHFNIEIDLGALESSAAEVVKGVREHVDEFVMKDGRSIFLLGQGRLVNLAAANGHPSSVMDMSFATQALATEWVAQRQEPLATIVHDVPAEIDQTVATLKLRTMGIEIDRLTPEQVKYLAAWEFGT